MGCSLKRNNIGDEGASAIAEALKTNSALEELKYVFWVWWLLVVGDVWLVWFCGAARALAPVCVVCGCACGVCRDAWRCKSAEVVVMVVVLMMMMLMV